MQNDRSAALKYRFHCRCLCVCVPFQFSEGLTGDETVSRAHSHMSVYTLELARRKFDRCKKNIPFVFQTKLLDHCYVSEGGKSGSTLFIYPCIMLGNFVSNFKSISLPILFFRRFSLNIQIVFLFLPNNKITFSSTLTNHLIM